MPYGTRRCQVFDELYSSTSQPRHELVGDIPVGRNTGGAGILPARIGCLFEALEVSTAL